MMNSQLFNPLQDNLSALIYDDQMDELPIKKQEQYTNRV